MQRAVSLRCASTVDGSTSKDRDQCFDQALERCYQQLRCTGTQLKVLRLRWDWLEMSQFVQFVCVLQHVNDHHFFYRFSLLESKWMHSAHLKRAHFANIRVFRNDPWQYTKHGRSDLVEVHSMIRRYIKSPVTSYATLSPPWVAVDGCEEYGAIFDLVEE